MKDLIIPLFGNISVGTVQKLYNKSRPPPPPPSLAGLTFMRRLLTEWLLRCPMPSRTDGPGEISYALWESLLPKP